MSSASTRGGGVGFLGLLSIAFIVLKLTGVISWGWAWVLLPLWGPFALLAVQFVIILLGKICEADNGRSRR
jgi:hypothetical protein